MTDPHWCPVEDCDYGEGEEKTLRQVMSHINAETSDSHDWEALRDRVREQEAESSRDQTDASETSHSGASEDAPEGGGSDGSTTAPRDDEVNSAGDQTEASVTSPSEATEDGPEMATPEEYKQQQAVQHPESTAEGTPEAGDESSLSSDSPSDGEQSATGDASSGFHVPTVSGNTLLMVAGLVLVAFVAWRVLGDDGVDYEEPEEQADADDDGQMVDVDAGTGGVMV